MKLIVNTLDIKLRWETRQSQNIYNVSSYSAPLYDVLVKDANDNNIREEKNLNFIQRKTEVSVVNINKDLDSDVLLPYVQDTGYYKLINSYIYNFSKNEIDFFNKNNRIGFYKDINFKITYSLEDVFEFNIRYLEANPTPNVIRNIYRTTDQLGIKIIIDNLLFLSSNFESILLMPKNRDKNFTPILIEDIEYKWLDSSESVKLLTAPLGDNLIHELDYIDVDIILLSYAQKEILKYFKNKYSNFDIKSFVEEHWPDKIISYYNITSEIPNNKNIYFNGYIYLYNRLSYLRNQGEYIHHPSSTIIKNIIPFKEINNTKTIKCLSDLEVSCEDSIDKQYGFYNIDKTLFFDIDKDLDIFETKNIESIEILDVLESYGFVSIFIEYLSNFTSSKQFTIQKISNPNFKFVKAYEKASTSNLAFLFKYIYPSNSYNEILSTNLDVNKNQLIFDKELISIDISIED